MDVSTLSPKTDRSPARATASYSDLPPAPVFVASLSPKPNPVRRLVVLVPSADLDEVELARRIWELASAARLGVFFLALCRNESEEPRMRRRLTTLLALTRDDRIAIETRLSIGANWRREVERVLQEDDVVVCLAGHTVGWKQQPVRQALNELPAAIWVLNDLDVSIPAAPNQSLNTLLFWSASLTTILVFLWLQIDILGISEHWAQNTLLFLSIPSEVGLLWLWNWLLV